MSDLDIILNEDKEWRKNFDSMKITGTCDARSTNCNKPATHWFGNTNRATCGDSKCIEELQIIYDSYVPTISYED